MVYGGTIRAGSCEGAPQLDIVSAFQAYGQYLQDGKTPEAERTRYNTVRNACPGAGACGGVSNGFIDMELFVDFCFTRCTQLIQWPVLQKRWE